MEENTIIEEGIETVTEESVEPTTDIFENLPTIVEESGNGDIPVLPLAIGIGIGGAIVLGVKKLWKMVKAKKNKDRLTVEEAEDLVDEATEENDDEEEE